MTPVPFARMAGWISTRGAVAILGFYAAAACVRAPRMCMADAGCAADAACVAGRCLSKGASAAIATATRVLYDPVDVAYLQPGAAAQGEGTAVFGRGDGALALLRFSVPLAPETSVVEAYLLLDRAPEVDADPGPVFLHAARIVGGWDPGSVSWGRQPAIEQVGASETVVGGVAGAPRSKVRLEIRSLVERWRKRRRDEMGLAVVADGRSASSTGVAFTLPAKLELYVK